jgi:NACHT domain
MPKPRKKKPTDTVRASRDGHEYHENWAARLALRLLPPDGPVSGIAVESLSPSDQVGAVSESTDIADLVLYFGGAPTFALADAATVQQFKYSVADQSTDFRASHAKKTVEKFAATYTDFQRQFGETAVSHKLDFELVTNRPIFKPLQDAVDALSRGVSPTEKEAKQQTEQFETAAGLTGKALTEFAKKFRLRGRSVSLPAGKHDLARQIVDWTSAEDSLAAARLGQLKEMVRNKAGHAGTDNNVIYRTDVLAALDISDPEDLLPCKAALADVGAVVEREQFADALQLLPNLSKPLMIHATGGVGKTVFMTSLCEVASKNAEVVFFDCFGGGAYRSPADARHLPKKGLIHIANTLSFRGLCDPILPGGSNVEALLNTFRRRLEQSVKTLESMAPGRELLLFIDAIDNAEIYARERNEQPFPKLLLESLHHRPVAGVSVIVSCRTERKPETFVSLEDFGLRPFSEKETAKYLRTRISDVSDIEISVAQSRSGGNARVLEYLVKTGRGLLDESELNKTILLDDLIQKRITDALASAIERGYPQSDIDIFLAGLAVLPPPVPLDEYAAANGMKLTEIESFASDLRPLLERNNQGLMFRDEPTETLVRNRYASSDEALRLVASNLWKRQDSSVYAARALPYLLQKLNDADQLFNLAFDDRIPSQITSTVGRRNIRYARLKAAVNHAASQKNYNSLVPLLVELSAIAVVDQRGVEYILENPDLIVTASDADAIRRLFEARTGWPGSRHARLAIANLLSGESGEAHRHATAANEWLEHYRRVSREDRFGNEPHPDRIDIAAIPLHLVAQGRPERAARYLQRWFPWYAYEVSQYVFDFLTLATEMGRIPLRKISKFVDALDGLGLLTAAVSFHPLTPKSTKAVLSKIAKAIKSKQPLVTQDHFQPHRAYQIQDGLRKAATLALIHRMKTEARAICRGTPHRLPRLHGLRQRYFDHDTTQFVFRAALLAAADDRAVTERDLMPSELVAICSSIDKTLKGEEFRDALKTRIKEAVKKGLKKNGEQKRRYVIGHEDQRHADDFLGRQLGELVKLTEVLRLFLQAKGRSVDKRFADLLIAWDTARKKVNQYRPEELDYFFSALGLEIALLALWSRPEISAASVGKMLSMMEEQNAAIPDLIQTIAILAARPSLQELAGQQAVKAQSLIQAQDEVRRRGTLYAELSRAMLPASREESTAYFRAGLDQMDAIGSEDYEFTNELLLFASSMRGDELADEDVHTLGNICELNLGDEPHKFFWGAFGVGMSKATGIRGLAKLSRLDDRSRVGLEYTLLPYLIALVTDGKIDPELALFINRLSDPAEYWEQGTTQFAKAIEASAGGSNPTVISELIQQYIDDNPGVSSDETVGVLAALADKVLGPSSDAALYLSAAQKRFSAIRSISNRHMNYHGESHDSRLGAHDPKTRNQEIRDALAALLTQADPADPVSLAKTMAGLVDIDGVWDKRGEFFRELRTRIPFAARTTYLREIANNDSLNLYWKMTELEACKAAWVPSSTVIAGTLATLAVPLLHLHADDLVSHKRFSGSSVKEISDLTGISQSDLVLELIKVYAEPDMFAAGSVWLGFASFIVPDAADGTGQQALKRFLSSEATELSKNVKDGPWQAGLYPPPDAVAVTAGLVWQNLGSPDSKRRWRAAHCMRSMARFGRWDVIDPIVQQWPTQSAGPLQARELGFLYLHARLWLLIALARIAKDFPTKVTSFSSLLISVATEQTRPHALMRHFAADALIACIDAGALKIDISLEAQIRTADTSSFARSPEKSRERRDFYRGRPDSVPKPAFEFHLDYDFHKHDVDNLSQVFGRGCWEVSDMMSGIVHALDPEVTGMYQEDGRKATRRGDLHGFSTAYQSYTQHLAWHAMFFAAGKFLQTFPVTNDSWTDGDPWAEWLGRYTLTRDDGLWLSDGTDRTPLDSETIMMETGPKDLVLTGDRAKILGLLGMSATGVSVIVDGQWHSSDGIRVHISSALVDPNEAVKIARAMMREDPMIVGVPSMRPYEDDTDDAAEEDDGLVPWIVQPSEETRIDEYDPFGVSSAATRPYIARRYSTDLALQKAEPFGRVWRGKNDKTVLEAEAWGRSDRHREGSPYPGEQLSCTLAELKKVLRKNKRSLFILMVLQRTEQRGYRESSTYIHTAAVALIDGDGQLSYVPGKINHEHKNSW